MAGPKSDLIADALNTETPELASLRASNIKLQRQLVQEKAKKEAYIGALYQAAKDAAVIIGHPPKVPVAKTRTAKGKTEHVALLHTTDWQGGKKTKDFDLDVLGRRLNQMVDITEALTERHGNPVNRIRVLFGGDDIEGVNIFPSQPFEIHAGLYEQVFAVVRYKRMIVDRLLAKFDYVDVTRKWGNHGRIGKFGELPDIDNLDLIADAFAREFYIDNPRVDWNNSMDYVQAFQIGNYKAALLHGNEFHKTFSAQRITSKVTSWQTIYDFGDIYMGHFHRRDTYGLPNGTQVYLTGSPESSNAYAADQLAAVSNPTQRLHFIDPNAGRVSSEHIIWLD